MPTLHRQRKTGPAAVSGPIVFAIDEIAYACAAVGDKETREQLSVLVRDLVARGRLVPCQPAGRLTSRETA